MMYMLKVDVLVAAIVFGVSGISILILFACVEAKEYVRTVQRTMQRIARSRHQNRNWFRVA